MITLPDITKLYETVIVPFHQIIRDITLPLPDHRPDNDAEHSWSLSFLAIALAPEVDPSLNVGLVGIYATIHDIVEVYAGDTSVWAPQEELAQKPIKEQRAQEQLKKQFPQFPNLHNYMEQYRSLTSNEAKFVYSLDKFINLLTIVEDKGYYYHTKHKITYEQHLTRLRDHQLKAHKNDIVAKYYDELLDIFSSSPEHFYKP